VEDHHAPGLAQRVLERRVRVLRLRPALPGAQERVDHVGLHRPGPEQRDVDDQVAERLGGELADQLALAGRLDLEAAEGLRGPDQPEGGRVVVRDGVQVDPAGLGVQIGRLRVVAARGHRVGPVHAGDLVQRVGHRGLHPDAEHVELEHAHHLDIVLVELAHRHAQPARLDRGSVEQPRAGQQHPARVQGHVPG